MTLRDLDRVDAAVTDLRRRLDQQSTERVAETEAVRLLLGFCERKSKKKEPKP